MELSEVYSSVEGDLFVMSCEERVSRNLTLSSPLDAMPLSYSFKNGVLGSIMKPLLRGLTVNCDDVLALDRSGSISFGKRYNHGLAGTEPFQREVAYGEESLTRTVNHILLIVNVFSFVSALTFLFFQNTCIVSILILEAPWFHFIILVGILFRLYTGLHTLHTSQNKVSRFRLLVRLRLALGKLRIQRLSYVELLSLRNSPACLHRFDLSCGIAKARLLSVQMNNVSLEDLSYLY